jgi:hypothetical protein
MTRDQTSQSRYKKSFSEQMNGPARKPIVLFFNMFVLLDNVQKLQTQFLKFSPPSFFMALEVFKVKSNKINIKTRKEG